MSTIDVRSKDARGDGVTLDTAAVQSAIDACGQAGGGKVVIPSPGTYLCGTLLLRRGVELHVERGAVLRASGDLGDYPAELRVPVVTGARVQEPELPDRAFLLAYEADNLAITGGGVIDGNGRAFVDSDAGHIYRMRGARQYLERPFTIFLVGCRTVDLREITIRDAAFWTVRMTGCQDVVIHGVRIDNDLKLPNNDGIDIDRCRNVRISDCHVSAGDDAICLKACRGAPDYGPCENITVTGCTLVSTSSALKLGNECREPIRDVVFDACVVRGSHRGLSIHSSEDGVMENILFSNMIVETRLFHSDWWGRGEPIYIGAQPWTANDGGGTVRHVRLRNIICRSENGVFIRGWKPGCLEDVTLDGVRVELSKWSRVPGGEHDIRPCVGAGLIKHPTSGFYLQNARNLHLRDCEVVWADGAPPYYGHALESHGCEGLLMDGFRGEGARAGVEARLVD